MKTSIWILCDLIIGIDCYLIINLSITVNDTESRWSLPGSPCSPGKPMSPESREEEEKEEED